MRYESEQGSGEVESDRAIRVLCVDDNFLVAEGIKIKLNLAGGFEWVGQLPDADHLTTEVKRSHPDIVLLDLDMPGKNAFHALTELGEVDTDVRVIVISGHVRQDLIDRAMDAGAWGYISKGEGTDTIVQAIRKVMNGQFVLGPDATAPFGRN